MNKPLIITTAISIGTCMISHVVYPLIYPLTSGRRELFFQAAGRHLRFLFENWVWILIASNILAWFLSLFVRKYVFFLPLVAPILLLYMVGVSVAANLDTKKRSDYTRDFSDPQVIELVTAIGENDLRQVENLARGGANLNAMGCHERTPLYVALQVGDKEMLVRLLELGADPNFRTPKGVAAAKLAVLHKDPEYLRTLLDRGLDPDLRYVKRPIIFYAIENNRWPQYEMLVAHGADLSAKTANNRTIPMYMATQAEYGRLAELLEKGVDMETRSNSGLTVVGILADYQHRFGGNPIHPAFRARAQILETLRAKGIAIPDGVPGVRY